MGSKKTKPGKAQLAEIIEEVMAEKVSFDTWFFRKMMAKEVRAHQSREIRSYFMQRGLKTNEFVTTFDEALKTY